MPSLTLVVERSTTVNGALMTPPDSKKYRLNVPLSPFVNTGGAAGERFVSLAASRLFVRSINKSRAIVLCWWVCQIDCHFPSGHSSVAMRSFAQVLHLHIRQRPVPLSACASHSGQARHVASRAASASGGVTGAPWRKNRPAAWPKRASIWARRETMCGGRVM